MSLFCQIVKIYFYLFGNKTVGSIFSLLIHVLLCYTSPITWETSKPKLYYSIVYIANIRKLTYNIQFEIPEILSNHFIYVFTVCRIQKKKKKKKIRKERKKKRRTKIKHKQNGKFKLSLTFCLTFFGNLYFNILQRLIKAFMNIFCFTY